MKKGPRNAPRGKTGHVRQRLRGHFSMIRDFHLADGFTLANGASGAAAILLAMTYVRDGDPRRIYASTALVVAALVFDVLDGRVARWRHKASPLGRELDSLADVVSFGVAPACLGFAIGLDGTWDALALLYFVACGISRLARYNVTAQELSSASGRVTYFEGTPIPTSVLIVFVLAALVAAGRVGTAMLGGTWTFGGEVLHPVTLLYVVSGTLMVSKTLRIPKP